MLVNSSFKRLVISAYGPNENITPRNGAHVFLTNHRFFPTHLLRIQITKTFDFVGGRQFF